jgi:hypothetical protein
MGELRHRLADGDDLSGLARVAVMTPSASALSSA